VAAGELAPDQALRAAVVLAAAGTAVAVAVRPLLGVVAISYLALTLSYSLWWRRVVVADLLAVAAGFVLRAIAGGVAAGVYLSEPFLVVTSACALFLVTGKRYAELTRPAASIGRATLNRYSPGALWVVLTGAAATAAFAYGAWAFDRPDRGPWFELSMVAFVVWLGRYAAMLASGAGESPEELILGDRALLVISAVWCLLFAGGAYAGA
jgi:decaprenyl-phosphate phosphoribosyltransferase